MPQHENIEKDYRFDLNVHRCEEITKLQKSKSPV